MSKNTISIKVHFEEPVYIDENTVEINWFLGGHKQSKPLVAKFNGQVWQTVNNK